MHSKYVPLLIALSWLGCKHQAPNSSEKNKPTSTTETGAPSLLLTTEVDYNQLLLVDQVYYPPKIAQNTDTVDTIMQALLLSKADLDRVQGWGLAPKNFKKRFWTQNNFSPFRSPRGLDEARFSAPKDTPYEVKHQVVNGLQTFQIPRTKVLGPDAEGEIRLTEVGSNSDIQIADPLTKSVYIYPEGDVPIFLTEKLLKQIERDGSVDIMLNQIPVKVSRWEASTPTSKTENFGSEKMSFLQLKRISQYDDPAVAALVKRFTNQRIQIHPNLKRMATPQEVLTLTTKLEEIEKIIIGRIEQTQQRTPPPLPPRARAKTFVEQNDEGRRVFSPFQQTEAAPQLVISNAKWVLVEENRVALVDMGVIFKLKQQNPGIDLEQSITSSQLSAAERAAKKDKPKKAPPALSTADIEKIRQLAEEIPDPLSASGNPIRLPLKDDLLQLLKQEDPLEIYQIRQILPIEEYGNYLNPKEYYYRPLASLRVKQSKAYQHALRIKRSLEESGADPSKL
ncbi:MAG: hypothetical protein OXT67_01690 [Zetaproteobacteria bacterium]|nr:hypothetical protein [Zetaproteobacteria bacterium]